MKQGAPLAYLAYPIDFAHPGTNRSLTRELSQRLRSLGFMVYLPGSAFSAPDSEVQPSGAVQSVNRAALAEADVLMAVVPPSGVRSLGVPMEIEQARAAGKPMLLLVDESTDRRSWSLPPDGENVRRVPPGVVHDRDLRWLRDSAYRVRNRQTRPPAAQAMYVQLDPGAALPSRSYEGDAGFDLYVSEETAIEPGEFIDVPVGCKVQLPDRVWGMILGRSSTLRKHDLFVMPGVIDTGYRGYLYAGVRSMRPDVYLAKVGERLAQFVPFANLAMGIHPVQVDVLSPSDRGELGFGSSGA